MGMAHTSDPPPEVVEYLRRNKVVAASIGMKANAEAAAKRLRSTAQPPKWLLELLDGIVERGEQVVPEVAKHRDEIQRPQIYR